MRSELNHYLYNLDIQSALATNTPGSYDCLNLGDHYALKCPDEVFIAKADGSMVAYLSSRFTVQYGTMLGSSATSSSATDVGEDRSTVSGRETSAVQLKCLDPAFESKVFQLDCVVHALSSTRGVELTGHTDNTGKEMQVGKMRVIQDLHSDWKPTDALGSQLESTWRGLRGGSSQWTDPESKFRFGYMEFVCDAKEFSDMVFVDPGLLTTAEGKAKLQSSLDELHKAVFKTGCPPEQWSSIQELQ